MTDWCILRMAGPRTIPVVRWLREAGVDAWTPMAKRRRTLPRSTKYRDIEAAVLPTFAFAPYDDLPWLRCLLVAPALDRPAFTIFSHLGNFPAITGSALQPLRDYEALLAENWDAFVRAEQLRRKQKRKKGRTNPRRAFILGQCVRIPDIAFQGLVGNIVEVQRNGDLKIVFESGWEIIADSCCVEKIHLESNPPEQGTAARAA